jgi:Zn ribbon nucleic-acid-binding protein
MRGRVGVVVKAPKVHFLNGRNPNIHRTECVHCIHHKAQNPYYLKKFFLQSEANGYFLCSIIYYF